MSIKKVLLHKGGSPEKPRVFLLSSTAVTAININGTTINTVLGINVGAKMFPLNDCQRATLQTVKRTIYNSRWNLYGINCALLSSTW